MQSPLVASALDNAATAAELDSTVGRLCVQITRKQERICAEGKSLGLLDEAHAEVDLVKPFAGEEK